MLLMNFSNIFQKYLKLIFHHDFAFRRHKLNIYFFIKSLISLIFNKCAGDDLPMDMCFQLPPNSFNSNFIFDSFLVLFLNVLDFLLKMAIAIWSVLRNPFVCVTSIRRFIRRLYGSLTTVGAQVPHWHRGLKQSRCMLGLLLMHLRVWPTNHIDLWRIVFNIWV